MSDDYRKQLYRNFIQKAIDELIELWQTNNRVEWSEITFAVIREILQERLAEIPLKMNQLPKRSVIITRKSGYRLCRR